MTGVERASTGSWSEYVRGFHEEHGGITEDLLRRTRDGDLDPYAWCASALPPDVAPVVDLACGSGPLADHHTAWVGLDRSRRELALAGDAHRGPLVCASATHAPFRDSSAGAVTSSMGLQVVEPMTAAVAEVARLLSPGRRAVLLLPSARPLPPPAVATYLWLQVVLRQRIRYPNDTSLRPAALRTLAERHGLEVLTDERRRFRLPVDSADVVSLFVRSLYLPGGGPDRQRRARRALSWRIGRHLDIPLRRVVLLRTSSGSATAEGP